MEQKIITRINGIEISAVLADGQTFIPIKPICEAIGVAFEPQFSKAKEHHILSSVITLRVTTGADGKNYEMVCLPEKYIYGWLFTINPANVKPEARNKVIEYQIRCYDALYAYFSGGSERAKELAIAESQLLGERQSELKEITDARDRISKAKSKISKIDADLEKLSQQRINPQPSLFD